MDKAKKKRIKRYVTWAGIAGLVLLLTVLPLLVKSSPELDGPKASVLSAAVESGSIHQVINGGGTLTSEAVDVKIPDGVRITEFLVKNGDHVTAGTPVAAVDKVSVLAVMSEVENTLDYLREKIEDAKDETVSGTIYATTGGRIKKVFAEPGESVQEVMLRDGCLALLSVDGKMAVKFSAKSDAATGQDLDVTLADGSVVTGRVESNLNGEVIVTIEDEGYVIGTNVSVAGLGEGTMYVHNAWKATAISGTISTVSAREEKTVSAGSALFTLTDTEYTGQWEHRLSQHQAYEELLQKLMKMYQTGTIDAPCDGVISGVDENSGYLLAANDGSWEAALLSNTQQSGYRIVFLSSTSCQCTGSSHEATCPEACSIASREGDCAYKGNGKHKDGCIENCNKNCSSPTGSHKSGCITFCAGGNGTEHSRCANDEKGNHYLTCIYSCTSGTASVACNGTMNHYLSCIESCDSAQKESAPCDATGAHKDSCIRSCIRADTTNTCRTGPHYIDCIGSCTDGSDCSATKHLSTCDLYGLEFYAQAAKVDSVGNDLVVFWDAVNTYSVEKRASGWEIVNGKLNESLLITGGTLKVTNSTEIFNKGDIVLAITGYRNGTAVYSTVTVYKKAETGTPSTGFPVGAGSGMPSGGFGGNGSYNGTAGEDEGLYDLDGQTLLTVIPQEIMTISISLDEQDISKVSIGMEATVKMNARPGKTYTAVISGIGFTGESDGGSSKFPVELTLEVDQDLLDGMSATAQIVLETKEDVPVIPLAALNGDSVNAYVYTALDKETGEPVNPVTVEVGLSDTENAEVLSGLKPGDMVYYHYYDVLELDTSA